MEKDEEWVRQAGRGGTTGVRRQVLEDGEEDAPEEARVEQVGVAGKTHALRENRRLQQSRMRRDR